MKTVNMFTPEGDEYEALESEVNDALDCGYSLDTRTVSEYLADKAAYGASMAAVYMGAI